VVGAAPGREVATAVPVPHFCQAMQNRVVDVIGERLLLVMLVMLYRRHTGLRHEGGRDAPLAPGVGLSVDVVDGRRGSRSCRVMK